MDDGLLIGFNLRKVSIRSDTMFTAGQNFTELLSFGIKLISILRRSTFTADNTHILEMRESVSMLNQIYFCF